MENIKSTSSLDSIGKHKQIDTPNVYIYVFVENNIRNSLSKKK